jgi:hypothetical protein
MVIVPWRPAPVFAAIVKFTLPLPLPPEPDVIAIHDALLVASQGQLLALLPGFAVTTTVPAPPPAEKFPPV